MSMLHEWLSTGMIRVARLAAAGCTLGAVLSAGCAESSLFRNLVAPVTGNITFILVNDTPYRAVFSYGTYNDLDRTPGAANLEQLRLEAHTSGEPVEVLCAHNAAVGTEAFITRALETDADNFPEFDPEAFSPRVGFSSFPAGSANAGSADVGYAEGIEVLLGVDFSCGDQLIFTFVEDESAPGRFRVDFAVLVDEE